MKQEIRNSNKNSPSCALNIGFIALITLFNPSSYADNSSKEQNSDIRNVIISDIELNIPQNFLIGNSALRNQRNDQALLLAFTYPEMKGGIGDGKNYVSLWLEDTREYNIFILESSIAFRKLIKEQTFTQQEYSRCNKAEIKRNKMLKTIWGTDAPFDLTFAVYPDNFLTCEGFGANPRCYYVLNYKELYILIILNESDLNKLNGIKQSTLKLIKQWENKNEN